MPVTNQWKTRGKAAEEAAKAAEAAKPEPPKEETDARARRVGRLQNLRSGGKAAADAKPAEPSPPVEEANGKEEKLVKRNVSSKWSASQEEPQKIVRKKRLEVTEGSVEEDEVHIDPITGGIVVENEPIRLEGVIRSDDPSEFQKPLEVEKGFAKNLANRFLNAANAQNDESSGRRFKMDVESGEPVVHENEPVRLEGVVRAGDKTEDVIGKRGSIRSIAGRFANRQPRKDSSDSDSDSDSDDDQPPARSAPAPRRSLAARSRIGTSGDGNPVVLAENTPAELDPNIVRSDGYRANDPVMEAGWARNMAERWKQQQEQEQVVEKKGSKPAWLIELENAKDSEHGVFENEPEVRDDVVRADDEKPDVISVQHTRSLRKMWNQIEKDKDAAEKMPKNRPLPRQKEPSPEPEPPKPPPPQEEPKPRFGRGGARSVGRLNFGQLQKEEPPKPVVQEPPPPAVPAGRGRGRRFGAAAAAAPAPAPAPQEVETKTSKLNMKPTLKQVPLRK